MWRILKRFGIAAIVLSLLTIAYARYHFHGMEDETLRQAQQLASGREACWVVGRFVQGDLPVVSRVDWHRGYYEPWADFKDRFINSEQAKPIHFGLLVPEDEDYQTALFAWSYRERVFWQVAPHNMAFTSARRLEDDCEGGFAR